MNIQEQNNSSNTSEENIIANNNEINNEQNQSDINTRSATMEYTNAVPSNYFNKASRQGRVERIEYQTYDYTQNN